jgi:hypothetical protein
MLHIPTLTVIARPYIGPYPFPASFTLRMVIAVYTKTVDILQHIMWLNPES